MTVIAERGDAFDRASLAAIAPRPTIGIVSGLYELFPENAAVLNSLRGLADAIEPGGHLIYTNQPWHPQVEFIARVLRNREGQPLDHATPDHGRNGRTGARRRIRESRDGSRSMGNVYRLDRARWIGRSAPDGKNGDGSLKITSSVGALDPPPKLSRRRRDCRSCFWSSTAAATGSRRNGPMSVRFIFNGNAPFHSFRS